MNALPLGRADSGFGCRCLCLWGRGEERGDEDTERAKRFEKKGQSRGSRQSAVWYVLSQSREKRRGRSLKGERVERWRTGPARVCRAGKESIHPWKGRGAWIGEPEVCTVYKLRSPGIGLGLEQFACWSGGFQG